MKICTAGALGANKITLRRVSPLKYPRARWGKFKAENLNSADFDKTQLMENSILYTFSTIAQALGGAFALLSAFVLFRFQSLDASMLNASRGLRSIWKTPSDLETYDTLRGLSVWPSLNRAIDAQVARMTAANEDPSFEVMATKTRLRAGQSLHGFLTWTFWLAVSLTFLVMTGSVAVIPYAHEIAQTYSLKCVHTLNLSVVAAFALGMFSYG